MGKTSSEVFPHSLEKYIHHKTCKLFAAVKVNRAIRTTFICKNQSGWCLTYKEPLFDADGNLVGIAGISNDLNVPENTHPAFIKWFKLRNILKELRRNHYFGTLDRNCWCICGSVRTLLQKIYHLTPRQMISKIRLQVATELLATDLPITQIGLRCGYTDHSAFVVSLSCIQACHLLCIGPLSKIFR